MGRGGEEGEDAAGRRWDGGREKGEGMLLKDRWVGGEGGGWRIGHEGEGGRKEEQGGQGGMGETRGAQ